MREISREEHEMILNLFIIAFSGYFGMEFMNKTEYENTLYHPIFLPCKDCFPMDEVCTLDEWGTTDNWIFERSK